VSGRSHRRPLWIALLVLVLAVLAGAAAVTASGLRQAGPAAGLGSRFALARVVPPQTVSPVRSASDRRSDALSALLASRAAAILHRDRVGFLATVDPAVPAFRRSQSRLFDALSTVRFASWRYDVDAPANGRKVPDPGRFGGAAETYAPRGVVVLYQLATYDTAPTSTSAGLTFVRRGARWRIAADSDFDATPGRTQREVWDYGPLSTASGPHTLIIGPVAGRRQLNRLRTEAERDIPRVTSVWGRGWSQRVVIVVPASQRQLAAMVNKPYPSLSRIAAVATAEVGGSGPTAAVGNRILVNPANLNRLGALGWQVVITHEITHVATRAETAAGAPTWLVEGFADYVAYRSTKVPVAAAAPGTRAAVRAGHLPVGLPTDQAFTGTNPNLSQAYEQAWLAVRLISSRAGQDGLLRFYRAVAGASAAHRETAYATALGRELAVSPSGFLALWRNYLRATL
jgi:hypothetical protein